MLLAFCSRGSCRALPISCGLRRCFGFGYRAKWDTLGAVCLQPDAAVLGQNAAIALFIENDIAVLLICVRLSILISRIGSYAAGRRMRSFSKSNAGAFSSGVPGMSLRV